MKIYKCSKIGEYHINHNEDALFEAPIGDDKIMLAVMDGCSMGTDSHFASSLLKKVLRKVSTELHYKEFIQGTLFQTDEILNLLLEGIFKNLAAIKNMLNLEQEEMLSTLILAIIDHKARLGNVIAIGDGLVQWNGKRFEFDQNNKPDYIGYHVDKNFHQWINTQTQKLMLEDIEDLSLSTDGIYSFKKYHIGNFEHFEEEAIIDVLLNDQKESDNQKMLLNKLDFIEKQYGLRNYDDISIIRIIF